MRKILISLITACGLILSISEISGLAQTKEGGFLMTKKPDVNELVTAILKADDKSDAALEEYKFWRESDFHNTLYYAYYLVKKRDSPVAHRIIYECLIDYNSENNSLCEDDNILACRHLCYSYKKGDEKSRDMISSLFILKEYRLYDICDSLCRDCKNFPFRE